MRSSVVFICCQMFLLSYASNETSKTQLGLGSSQFNVVDSTANLRDETVLVSYFSNSSKGDNNSLNRTSASSLSRTSKIKNGRIKFKNENKQKTLKNNSNKRGLKIRTLKSKNEGDEMTKHFIRNSSVVCNDGSTPGYYLKKSSESNRWILFLEGGWLCSDGMSCLKRWFQSPQFMTSQNLPHVMKGVGILSSNRQENSFFFNGNHVFVPYCSSDSWSGSFKATDRDAFSFMGSNIVEEVVKDLVEVHRMGEVQSNDSLNSESTLVYLAGSSAGGTGVLLNIDRVALLINRLHNSGSERSDKQPVIVRGISDSGWFIDNTQFRQTICTGLQQCSPLETIKKAMPLWNAIVPSKCHDQYASDPWKCFFGQYVYPTLSTEVFVVQNLYDGAQLVANNVGSPVDSEQWNFIKGVGMETRETLSHVRSLFAPGCLLHVLLTRSDWSTITVKNTNLPSQLQCWEKHELNKLRNKLGSETKSKLKKSNSVQSNIKFASPLNDSRYKNLELKDRRAKRRKRLSEAIKKQNKEPHKRPQCEKMKANVYRQIDSCRWPHCNLSCPKLRDPYSGKEIDLIEILSQFDLDLNTVADALGVQLASLRSMTQRELMKLLVTSGNKR